MLRLTIMVTTILVILFLATACARGQLDVLTEY